MREPVQRTWSHYAMWALYYKWEKQRDVVSLLAREMNQTVRCNASLALHPSRLLELPYAELAVFGRCTGAIKYLGRSLYAASLLPALRLFRRPQFLLLRTERVLSTPPAQLLDTLSRFTGLGTSVYREPGLHTHPNLTTHHTTNGQPAQGHVPKRCYPSSTEALAKQHATFLADSSGAAEARAFDGMRAELARFFAPFNAALVAELGSSWGDDEALWEHERTRHPTGSTRRL